MSEAHCFMYEYEVEEMNTNLLKASPKAYELMKLVVMVKELARGFYVKKCNKATKKGTRFRFELCKNEDTLTEKYNELHTQIKELSGNDTVLDINFNT